MLGSSKRGRCRGRNSAVPVLCALSLIGLSAGFIGCGRSGRSTAAPPTTNASAQAEDEIARVLGELTQLVRKYSAEQRQPPASLDDLVAQGYLKQVPAAPAGKRFVITKNLQVELANR